MIIVKIICKDLGLVCSNILIITNHIIITTKYFFLFNTFKYIQMTTSNKHFKLLYSNYVFGNNIYFYVLFHWLLFCSLCWLLIQYKILFYHLTHLGQAVTGYPSQTSYSQGPADSEMSAGWPGQDGDSWYGHGHGVSWMFMRQ